MTPKSDSKASTPRMQAEYWRRTRRLSLYLLVVWFLTTFIIIFFARELSSFTVLGWPFSFYMAAQGTTLIYVLIVGIYAWRMRDLDKSFKGEDTNAQ